MIDTSPEIESLENPYLPFVNKYDADDYEKYLLMMNGFAKIGERLADAIRSKNNPELRTLIASPEKRAKNSACIKFVRSVGECKALEMTLRRCGQNGLIKIAEQAAAKEVREGSSEPNYRSFVSIVTNDRKINQGLAEVAALYEEAMVQSGSVQLNREADEALRTIRFGADPLMKREDLKSQMQTYQWVLVECLGQGDLNLEATVRATKRPSP